MSRRYDSKTTTFTPDGRLQQIEYAIEAINKTGSSIGVLTNHGVILATEKYDVSFLLEESVISEKIYAIDKHLYTVVCGLAADANFLIDVLREEAQRYRLKFREPMPIQQLIVYVCDIKQQYTQSGSSRPFGTAFLFAGYDKYNKFQLYSTDPSGNYAGWKATAIGANNTAANSFLKQQYKQDFALTDGLNLALKALVKTMQTTSPSSKKIELVTITTINGEVVGKTLNDEEIKALLIENGLGQKQKQGEK